MPLTARLTSKADFRSTPARLEVGMVWLLVGGVQGFKMFQTVFSWQPAVLLVGYRKQKKILSDLGFPIFDITSAIKKDKVGDILLKHSTENP